MLTHHTIHHLSAREGGRFQRDAPQHAEVKQVLEWAADNLKKATQSARKVRGTNINATNEKQTNNKNDALQEKR